MRILLVGDVMLGRLVSEVLKQKPKDYPWGDTLDIFKQSDFRVCNLECVISDKGQPWSITEKTFHFRTDSKNVEVLEAASINAVSLANNHTLDFEYEAMFECLEILDKEGIAHAGCGSNLDKATSLAIFEIDELKIGMIAFTDNEPLWEAKENKPGVFYVTTDLKDKRTHYLISQIKNAKKEVDILIVSAHAGPNWGYHPPKEHIPFFRALIDAGADIIFGHSGHVFRGIEIYQSRPIIYCAGDFIDDYAVDWLERNDQSFIFQVETEGSKIKKLKLYPTVIRNFQAQKAKGQDNEEIVKKMSHLCQEFRTEVFWVKESKYLEIKI